MMLTIKEVAAIFRVTRATINTMMRKGDLKYVRIGGSIRFNEDEIERIKREGVPHNDGEYGDRG
jgi:excisionase family DNA binding protein